MFIGHFSVAFAAKRVIPQVSLGTAFVAVQFADLLWPVLVLAGVESFAIAPGITAVTPLDFFHYPYSHSLVALLIWGALFGGVYWVAQRSRPAVLVVLAALVVSHWLLDVVAHRPDMPLAFDNSKKLGLGLWNSVPGTLAVEFLLLAVGVSIYVRSTVARDRTGRWALWGLVAFLAAVQLANVFGPPPPSVDAVAWTATSMWLLVGWGYWVDRHRTIAGE